MPECRHAEDVVRRVGLKTRRKVSARSQKARGAITLGVDARLSACM